MKRLRVLKPVFGLAVFASLVCGAFLTRGHWLPLLVPPSLSEAAPASDDAEPTKPASKVIVGDQAQENMGLVSEPLKPTTFWKTLQVPGMVVDRPGLSDRGIVSPTTAVVSRIHHVPGDAIKPNEPLFTLGLLSESLQLTQTELLKATLDLKTARTQHKLLLASSAAVAGERLVESEKKIALMEATVASFRRELLLRGIRADAIDGIAQGTFVTEITIHAPPFPTFAPGSGADSLTENSHYELEDLKVELGQQALAGQVLCRLAIHELLAIEGRAFRDETPFLEKSVRENWPVQVDFQEDPAAGWSEVKQVFHIRHLSNTIDPANRTFAFRIPLENQSHETQHDGRRLTLWRFRPGQKVRIHIRIEEMKNVFVLPADGVAREGPEAFVFLQNVNTFERKPVRALYQDQRQVVIANDGSLIPGSFAARNGAAQLNRMIKAGGSGAAPKGYHIHADGSLHKNEDEGK